MTLLACQQPSDIELRHRRRWIRSLCLEIQAFLFAPAGCEDSSARFVADILESAWLPCDLVSRKKLDSQNSPGSFRFSECLAGGGGVATQAGSPSGEAAKSFTSKRTCAVQVGAILAQLLTATLTSRKVQCHPTKLDALRGTWCVFTTFAE